jgi:hypothetical protein
MVGNVKAFMKYRLPSCDYHCFICGDKEMDHGQWNYIYSWFFVDEKNIHLILANGFKIMATYYENNNDFTKTIMDMKYISSEWISGIKKSSSKFYSTIKQNKNKTQYQHIASLVSFENEMIKIKSTMKSISNIPNPYINHNPFVCTGFTHKNITYNKHINYLSNTQIVILPKNKPEYQTMWNITNTLQSLISSIEHKKINHNDMTIISYVACEYQDAYKQVSLFMNKQIHMQTNIL